MAALFIQAKNGKTNKCQMNGKTQKGTNYYTQKHYLDEFQKHSTEERKPYRKDYMLQTAFIWNLKTGKTYLRKWFSLGEFCPPLPRMVWWHFLIVTLGGWGLGGCFCYVVDTESSNAVKHSRMYRTLTQQRIIRTKIPIVPRTRLENCRLMWSVMVLGHWMQMKMKVFWGQ